MNFDDILKEKLYAQSAVAAPLPIFSAAGSGFIMKKFIQLSYTGFLFIVENDFATMCYLQRDLDRLSTEINKRLSNDTDYFHKVKKIYDEEFRKSQAFFKQVINLDFVNMSSEKMIELIKQASYEVGISVGVGHIIEPFSLTTDLKVKEMLSKYIPDIKELNRIFSILMAPVRKSFVNEYEDSLKEVSQGKKSLQQHTKDFFWIKNDYAGRHKLTEQHIKDELSTLNKDNRFEHIVKQKQQLLNSYNFDKTLLQIIKNVEFMTYWQDERKKHIMIAIEYLDILLEQLAKKLDVDVRLLRYITPVELDPEKIKSLSFQEQLKQRIKGSAYVWTDENITFVTGDDYSKFKEKLKQDLNKEQKEISGTTASIGTAIGRVKVLTTVESMQKLEEGDILVASMTRPELVPAMKKAAAVITDEGGITCHAAIVSRELGIPCIIGTKIATKVLKDGDLVEIKGNHGLIIILEKAK